MISRSLVFRCSPRQEITAFRTACPSSTRFVSPFSTTLHRPADSADAPIPPAFYRRPAHPSGPPAPPSFYRRPNPKAPRVHWSERLPMIIRPSVWKSILPRQLRTEQLLKYREDNRNRPRGFNPATWFLLMFLLVGSFGIHFINLRQKFASASRQAENRIAMLQEVLRRVKAGEDVDVEKMLGTGNPLAEQEWEDVIKHIEEEDRLWQSKEMKKARKQARKEAREAARSAMVAEEDSPKAADQFAKTTKTVVQESELARPKKRIPGFY